MKKALSAIKEIELPFFGNIYNVFLFIESIAKEKKEIKVKFELPEELKFLEEILKFEIKTIEKHYKIKIII